MRSGAIHESKMVHSGEKSEAKTKVCSGEIHE